MPTVQPILQPTNSIVVTTNPADTGILGTKITIVDNVRSAISVAETTRGLRGFPGVPGTGFARISYASNTGLYIQPSGYQNTLYLQNSGTIIFNFNDTTKTLTIGSDPFSSGDLIPLNYGGTNNPGIFDTNYIIYYDGNKLASTSINADTFLNVFNSGRLLYIGDGSDRQITYKITENLNFISSTGIFLSFNDSSNSISLSTSAITGVEAGSGIIVSSSNNKVTISTSGSTPKLNPIVASIIFS